MLGCTATHGQQPTNKTPADSGGVIIGTSAGGVSTITSSSSGCQQTGMDNNCWVSFNMTHTHNLLQQIKELAGMLADVLGQKKHRSAPVLDISSLAPATAAATPR